MAFGGSCIDYLPNSSIQCLLHFTEAKELSSNLMLIADKMTLGLGLKGVYIFFLKKCHREGATVKILFITCEKTQICKNSSPGNGGINGDMICGNDSCGDLRNEANEREMFFVWTSFFFYLNVYLLCAPSSIIKI